jgi:hypothetical protein
VRPPREEFELEFFGSGDQSADNFDNEALPLARDVKAIKSHVQGYLIVSAPSGMDFCADLPNQLDEAVFNVHMDVFQLVSKREAPYLDFLTHLIETAKEGLCVLGGNDVLPGQHPDVGTRSLDIPTGQSLVELNRTCETLYRRMNAS